jgi:hypothetical protein
MVRHDPTSLPGPVSKARSLWIGTDSGATETDTLMLEPPNMPDPLSHRADIRLDLVRRVRREIAAGAYETPEKWEAALDKLLGHLEQDD